MPPQPAPKVAIVMGSQSDWPTMQRAAAMLDALGVAYEARIVSAHRTPERMYAFAREAEGAGLAVIIAGAGGAAHLPGMLSALTHLPVLGVPVQSKALSGQDSLLSIVQMPAGVPTATFAIGEAGAANAGQRATPHWPRGWRARQGGCCWRCATKEGGAWVAATTSSMAACRCKASKTGGMALIGRGPPVARRGAELGRRSVQTCLSPSSSVFCSRACARTPPERPALDDTVNAGWHQSCRVRHRPP